MKLLSKISFLFLTAALVFASSGCKDDSDPQLANLAFQFDYTIDGQAFSYGTDFKINGVTVNLETAMFYVSGISLEPEEGDEISVEGKHLLVSPDAGSQEVTVDLKPEHYHMVKFDIGVQPEANSQTEEDYTSRDASDPLAAQNPSMHWNWNSGYRFLRIDGQVDTDGDDVVDTPLAFHLGTDALLTPLSYTLHHDFEPGDNTLAFEFDIAKFFAGVDLSTEVDTHTGNNLPLAEKVASNLSSAISVKQ